jgi:hypothetical protein
MARNSISSEPTVISLSPYRLATSLLRGAPATLYEWSHLVRRVRHLPAVPVARLQLLHPALIAEADRLVYESKRVGGGRVSDTGRDETS